MKKNFARSLSFILILAILLSCMAGCGKKEEKTETKKEPIMLSAPEPVTAEAISSADIVISWTKPPTPAGIGDTYEPEYVIEHSSATNAGFEVLAKVTDGSISCVQTGLPENTAVFYRVKATVEHDGEAVESTYSAVSGCATITQEVADELGIVPIAVEAVQSGVPTSTGTPAPAVVTANVLAKAPAAATGNVSVAKGGGIQVATKPPVNTGNISISVPGTGNAGSPAQGSAGNSTAGSSQQQAPSTPAAAPSNANETWYDINRRGPWSPAEEDAAYSWLIGQMGIKSSDSQITKLVKVKNYMRSHTAYKTYENGCDTAVIETLKREGIAYTQCQGANMTANKVLTRLGMRSNMNYQIFRHAFATVFINGVEYAFDTTPYDDPAEQRHLLTEERFLAFLTTVEEYVAEDKE